VILFLAYLVAAFVGIYAHWLKSWLRETIASSFVEYMVNEPKHTGATLFTMVTALITLHQTGSLDDLTQQSVILAFGTGFVADSTLNKE
jgi:hypothetical protein